MHQKVQFGAIIRTKGDINSYYYHIIAINTGAVPNPHFCTGQSHRPIPLARRRPSFTSHRGAQLLQFQTASTARSHDQKHKALSFENWHLSLEFKKNALEPSLAMRPLKVNAEMQAGGCMKPTKATGKDRPERPQPTMRISGRSRSIPKPNLCASCTKYDPCVTHKTLESSTSSAYL